jgi:hypothetical protein
MLFLEGSVFAVINSLFVVVVVHCLDSCPVQAIHAIFVAVNIVVISYLVHT